MSVREWMQRHWKQTLAIIGVSSLPDLIKEHFRAHLMDWALSVINLGTFGRWLIANPTSFLTLVIIGALVFIAISSTIQTAKKRSPILDHRGASIESTRIRKALPAMTFLVIIFSVTVVAYGHYKYLHRMRADIKFSNATIDLNNPQAAIVKITLENDGDAILLTDSVVQLAVIVIPPLQTPEQEDALFASGPWQRIPLHPPLGKFDLAQLSVGKPKIGVQQLKQFAKKNVAIYLLAEIYGRDDIGPLPAKQGCWYALAADSAKINKCLGHN